MGRKRGGIPFGQRVTRAPGPGGGGQTLIRDVPLVVWRTTGEEKTGGGGRRRGRKRSPTNVRWPKAGWRAGRRTRDGHLPRRMSGSPTLQEGDGDAEEQKEDILYWGRWPERAVALVKEAHLQPGAEFRDKVHLAQPILFESSLF